MFALIVSNCTGHVEIPREQFEAASHDDFQSHRIRTKKTEYIAEAFSLTDSTLVISRLAPADTRYRHEKPPFAIPRDAVVSIAGVQSKGYVPIIAIGVVIVVFGGLYLWFIGAF